MVSGGQSEGFMWPIRRLYIHQVARQYGHHMVADIINSPREKHRSASPTTIYYYYTIIIIIIIIIYYLLMNYYPRPTFPTQFMEFLKASAADEACVILWDEHLE